jgi:hypothetical protein
MKFIRLFRRKLVAVALACTFVVVGATAVFAATPAGQSLVHTITGPAHAMATPDSGRHKNDTHANDPRASNHQANNGNKSSCPGLPDAQRLAAQFSLNTSSQSDDIQAICSLHEGTFKGTTPSGTLAASNRVFGFGEIDELLTYAQHLAGQNKADVGGKLTSANVRGYLAEAIRSCGTTALDTCLKTNVPGFQAGNSNDGSHGSGGGHGKPSSTPTPHH